ncbi:hypothetical protein EIP91_011089 [Steccherinum ochraceum]|uniref:Uncharacterized protein n=1 Tax=Steccherinum ochraceum TaxID=92696 RepID=A0A4R0S1U2_9APHY|nr:hypothetical protein EIP91_011089 [Steccherinum ochraceum]
MIAGARCAKRLRLAKASPVVSASVTRALHAGPPRRLAFALPVQDAPHSSTSHVVDYRQRAVEQKYQDLEMTMRHNPPNPSRTWAYYVELINFVGLYNIPLETHQKVLRACSASPEAARVEFNQRFLAGGSPYAPHEHEARFKAVVQNMREAGHTPDLEDYNYILQQFAAVGYHYGAVRVLREFAHVGLQPSSKSYGLCMQALCHRLSLPAGRNLREKLRNEAVIICNDLVRQMHAQGVPFTAATTDLIYRILTTTMSMETLENMLKVIYAVDLSYPDRPPLEFWQGDSTERIHNPAGLSKPLPFSSSALNTTIVVLGRLGDVSKLVQAFEVLTTPLPSRHASVPSSSFEDDEDDDFGVNSPAVASFPLPYAQPNTFTYEALLRSVSLAGSHVFARHYLVQALALDRQVDKQLRHDCLHLLPEQVLAPRFGVNRRMILSVFSLANRYQRTELLRWVHAQTKRVVRRKRGDIKFYTRLQAKWANDPQSSPVRVEVENSVEDAASEPIASTSASSKSPKRLAKMPKQPWFDVNLDSQVLPSEQPRKPFNVDLHLSLLKRDLEVLVEFEQHVEDVLGRTTQRVKERLGRRVWTKKSIWMRHSARREVVQPSTWLRMVNFRSNKLPEDGVSASKEAALKMPRTNKSPRDIHEGSFFTPSVPPRIPR